MSDAPATVPAPADSSQPAENETPTPAVQSQPAASELRATGESERSTIEQIASFEDFLRYLLALDGDLKPFALAKNSSPRKALALTIDFDEFQEPIAALAARDTKLATTLALLITADRSEFSGRVRQNTAQLAARIMQGHAAFTDDNVLRERLSQLAEGDADPETFSRTLVRMENLLQQDFDGKLSMKPPAVHALADNATHAVVLIAASAAHWDVTRCIDALSDNIWGKGDSGSGSSPRDREKLATLPKGARAAAALIVNSGRIRLREIQDEHERAATQLETARAQIARLSNDLDAARVRETEQTAECVRLRSALEQEAHARLSERMNATSDFETMRVDTVRVISQQVEMLEDALDALQHGQTQITDEFVRRSIKKLQQRLTALRPRAKQEPGETEE
ncbi:hypothetical protein NOVA_21950 [Nocardia nova]|uniref:hypothetical protein n=1 Tax=Nocardia nova TaxID=37330 RepID=UPI001C463558|nr:hypothetical protein [Nocardia nova]MBV7705447.1 hypothetical protein [Nocardia nova]